ncbi:lactosylceramide 4-alpha-galactosyltransferase-like [Culex pipiens pallens]|uniref:lactosylceramide 4-alpha-galactosyltransferase-like n=1 Tax=Culex pipiens pallens TaxID=42434 RepID=UPI00195401E5|nr:lactosylceramide 4-alpha-galactosyltransferase-like [Culex pipiens pallens]
MLYFTYLNIQKFADPNIVHLSNVQHNESEFSSGKNIFFIVSTLSPRGEIKLTARQACSIESAARTNPDWSIFPLFVTATWFNALNNEFISPLLRYGNIHLRTVDLETFALGTPLEDLFARHALQKSSYPVEHTSDVLRLLVLYKYGGTYLDTDVVLLKSFDLLRPNFLGSEGHGYVANGVINLQATGDGHRFAEACINDLAQNFNGTVWAANGPFLVTRNLRRFCNVSDVASMSRERCGGQLTVHPPDVFYRIRYPRHEWFFEPERTDAVMTAVRDDILVHVWNKATGGIPLKVDGTTAYVKLAHEFCPNVIKGCDEFF